jgi:Protein of unknown function (DUF3443)
MAFRAWARARRFGVCACLGMSALSCGGGGGDTLSSEGSTGSTGTTAPASNVASVIVDAGPANNAVNTLFTTVTVCAPGSTTDCQTIDHVQVDTQSFGLRLLAPVLTLSLPALAASNGGSLVECQVFEIGYVWGPVAMADIQIGGESASSVPIQLIGDPRFPNIPANCSDQATMSMDTVAAFGANGIIGIGFFTPDCGSICASVVDNEEYFSCSSSSCSETAASLATQVANPVASFGADNNGSFIELPSVPAQGAATITGSLIFGIDTESNNASGSETVLTVDPNSGYLTASFNGQSLNMSFIDSGTDGIFFDDANIAACTDAGLSQFYCPASDVDLTVTFEGMNAVSAVVDFTVGNAQTLGTNNPNFVVLPTLAATNPLSGSFDYGLPFFYGRRVATALENAATSVGTGPYVAF